MTILCIEIRIIYFPLFNIIYFFFFNDTATTEIYTLSLHDALPIYLLHAGVARGQLQNQPHREHTVENGEYAGRDRDPQPRSEEHTSELQSPCNIVCRLLLEKKKIASIIHTCNYYTNQSISTANIIT